MSITQLGYLGIGVSDTKKWEEFATGILGLEVSDRLDDGTLYLRMDEHDYRFILLPDGADDLAYAGWQVATAAALQELNGRLQAAGVRTEPGTKEEREFRKVVDLIKFEDPSGFHMEAFYGPLIQKSAPFQPSRPISGFKTGDLGMGHIVLVPNDLEETTSFYRDVLGMRISDYVHVSFGPMDRTLVFFHCNGRHHSIAFGQLPGQRKMSHFMMELNTVDDVGSAYYLCQDQNVPIAMSLGRHSNDQMLSFYMTSPSGFSVEYGYGARVVDDANWVVQHYRSGSNWGHRRSQVPAGAAPARS